MSDDDRDELSDAQLITRARSGDADAYASLYSRHSTAAKHLANKLIGASSADDIVSEAFTRIYSVLQRGGGPDFAFRPYLLTTVHNAYVSHVRVDSNFLWIEDYSTIDADLDAVDETEQRQESSVLARAFRSLPERWQVALWHSCVEQDSPADVGKLLGLSPNAVAALSFRAREGLRQAYLAEHLALAEDSTCRRIRQLMPAYARGQLGARQAGQVDQHLDECASCNSAILELESLTLNKLGALLGPAILGPLAAASLPAMMGTSPDALSQVKTRVPRHAGSLLTVGLCLVAATALTLGVLRPSHNAPKATETTLTNAVPEPPRTPATAQQPADEPTRSAPVPSPPAPVPSPPAPAPVTQEAAPVSVTTPALDKPTPRPSQTPTPTPKPTPTPAPTPRPVYTTYDLSISLGVIHRFTNTSGAWAHVELPIEAAAAGSIVTMTVDNLQQYSVHSDPTDPPVTCSSADVTITCEVHATSGTLRIDLLAAPQQNVHVTLTAPLNIDPDQSDNDLRFSLAE